MTPEAPRPLSILIAALGGQGGGVLTDWIVAAAEHAGLAAQATSIPGVAQRTGATTYYLEVFPAPLAPGDGPPVFSLYPTPGDVDVIIASEYLEAGRTLELDYASPDRTTLVASTHRLFAIGERTVSGDGIFPAERLEEAVRALTRRAITFDALAVRGRRAPRGNAVLLGALAAAACCRSRFRLRGGHSRGWRRGWTQSRRLQGGRDAAAGPVEARAPSRAPGRSCAPSARAALGRRGAAFLALCVTARPSCRPRCIKPWARGWRASWTTRAGLCGPVPGRGAPRAGGGPGTAHGAVRPAPRRVDELRGCYPRRRPQDARARFERIRAEQGAPPGAPLSSRLSQARPRRIYASCPRDRPPFAHGAERRWPKVSATPGQHVRTTTVLGFLRVWLLGRLRGLRPISLRFEREWALITRWRQPCWTARRWTPSWRVEVAETAALVRGYGEVRRRLSAAFVRLLDEGLPGGGARSRGGRRLRARGG